MAERAGLDQIENRRQAASVAGRNPRVVPAPKRPRAFTEKPEDKTLVSQPAEPGLEAEPEVTTDAVKPVQGASRLVERKPVKDKPTRWVAEVPEEAPAALKRSRVRQTPIQLDEASDRHLRVLKREAVLAELPYSASAVVRLALHELVRTRGYDAILDELAENPSQMRVAPPSGRA